MTNDKINYHNYLLEKLIDEKISHMAIFNPGVTESVGCSFEFSYDISTSEASLVKQANSFAKKAYIGGSKTFKMGNEKAFSSEIDNLRDAYIYSYLKAVWIGHQFTEFGIVKDNFDTLMFGGHKVLLQTLMRRRIFVKDEVRNTYLDTGCTVSQKEIDDLNQLPEGSLVGRVWRSGTEGESDTFFSTVPERVLNFLSCTNENIDVRTSKDEEFIPHEHYPLGNTCYNVEMDEVLYLSSSRLAVDFRSYYWSFACFVRIAETGSDRCCQNIYRTAPISDAGGNFISSLVYSITNIGGPTLQSGNRPSGRNRNGDNGGKDTSSGSGNGRGNNGGKGPNSPNNDQRDTDDDNEVYDSVNPTGGGGSSNSGSNSGVRAFINVGDSESNVPNYRVIDVQNKMVQNNNNSENSDRSRINRWLSSAVDGAKKSLTAKNFDRFMDVVKLMESNKMKLTKEDLLEIADHATIEMPRSEIERRESFRFGPFSSENLKRDVTETSKSY